jgi:hypothetical protein
MKGKLSKGTDISVNNLKQIFPYANDLRFYSDHRDELALINNLGGNGAILPACFNCSTNAKYINDNDNGFLDIGVNDFSLCAWIKSDTAAPPALLYGFVGKYTPTALSGRYGILTLAAANYIFAFQTTTALYTITSAININDLSWHFHRAEINQTTKIARYFIDEVQIVGDLPFLGTFNALAVAYDFYVGAMNAALGAGANYGVPSKYSDIYVFNRLLTVPEITNIYNNRITVNGSHAHWTFLGNAYSNTVVSVANLNNCYDSSGNGIHLYGTGSGIRSDFAYDIRGSRHGLNNGYTLYSNGYEFIYVPYLDNNTENVITQPFGFFKVRNITGNIYKHNLSNSLLRLPDANFVRSSVAIYNAAARAVVPAGYYDIGNPTDWHITEINNLQKYDWTLAAHHGLTFAKINNNSYGMRKILDNIFSYVNDKAGANYNTVLSYCGDLISNGVLENEYYYYKYTTDNIVFCRDSKYLRFNAVTNTVSLSFDEGLTYPNSIIVAGLGKIQFSWICASGIIAFSNGTTFYRSVDNLATVNVIVPLDTFGVPYVADPDDSFAMLQPDNFVNIGGVEYVVWGNYDTTANPTNANINVFYTVNDFANVRSGYLFGVTLPILTARHIHAVSFNPNDNSFIVQTGDGTNTCNWLRGIYNFGLGTWAWNILAGDNEVPNTNYTNYCFYKTVGIGFPAGFAYWGSDSDDPAKSGIWYVAIANLTTKVNYLQRFPFPYVCNQLLGFLMDSNIIGLANLGYYYLAMSKDNGLTFNAWRMYGIPVLSLGLVQVKPKSTNNWYIIHIYENTEAIENMYLAGVILVKLK